MKSDLYIRPEEANKNEYYLFLFSKIKGLTPRIIISLIQRFTNPENLYYKIIENSNILDDKINKILQDKNFISQVQSDFAKLDEDYITILDPAYPNNLKNIYDPPLFLFYRGNLDLLKSKYLMTVVGSRKTTDYHRNSLQNIFANLRNTPLIIVSGLAVGIDTLAHRHALDNNLPTISVLGSSLNKYHLYPQVNLRLSREIVERGGLLISEQSSLTKTQLYHFPKRNRILAGLSKASIVISGAKKSGTLITAQVAIDEGREVMALPGNINLSLNQGPNKLIKEGAAVLDSAEDILRIYNIDKTIKAKKILFTNKHHAKIYSLLQTESIKLVALANLLNIPLSQLNPLISEMEIRGLIKLNNLNQLEII